MTDLGLVMHFSTERFEGLLARGPAISGKSDCVLPMSARVSALEPGLALRPQRNSCTKQTN